MRYGVLAGLLALSAPAAADPAERLEAAGFLGVDRFGDQIGLGGAVADEQRPQTSPMFGARLTYLAGETPGRVHLALGGETELSMASSWTGYGFADARPSYFSPVFGYRANAIVRLGGMWFEPHVVGGGGGATVASSSPFMKKETVGVYFWGAGVSFPVTDRWRLRLDARQTIFPDRGTGNTSTYELSVAIGGKLGLAREPAPVDTHVEVVEQKPPEPDKDSDGDGLPDKVDACPLQPEVVNGIDDQDGCPEADPDGDGVVGSADKCPDRAEDFDHFEDDDGCPEDDNDKDGIVDARDACPNQPETKNGIDDDDGCPDQVPADVLAALQGASAVKFEGGRARLSKAAKAALDKALTVMINHRQLRITITGHPEKEANDKTTELAKKRAEVVKWYLVEQGVAADQINTAVGDIAAAKAPIVDAAVATGAPPAAPKPPAAPPAPAPKPAMPSK